MARKEPRRATILGWTGRGRLEDAALGARRVLGSAGIGGRVYARGEVLVVLGPEPASVASALRNMPGLDWLAVGASVDSFTGLAEAARGLAGKYAKRNARFTVVAYGGRGVAGSDIAGTVVSSVLEGAKGARVDDARPQVVFRAQLDEEGGAVGVELGRGPGGVPVGAGTLDCLVSGGMHSAVLCWMALLSGHKLRMLHARVDEESVAAVARLYAELSHRVDPSALRLEIYAGRDPGETVSWVAGRPSGPVYAGFHVGCGGPPPWPGNLAAPLYFAQEEWFLKESASLGVKDHQGRLAMTRQARAPDGVLTFGGARADVSGVLDGLSARSASGR